MPRLPFLRGLVPTSRAAQAALGLAVVQCAVLSFLVNRQITGAGSNSWDLGIFNQAVYDMAHGKSFMTYRGMDVYGHHFHPTFFLLAPLSWLGGGARALSLVQVFMLCLGAWPAFLLGRDRVTGKDGQASPKAGLLFATVYLLHPMVTGLSWWMFHPESLAVAAILGAWWAAGSGRWKHFAAFTCWAVLSREDIALAIVGLGIAVAFMFRHDRRALRVGLVTLVGAGVYWASITQIVMPARLGTDEPYYVKDFWGHLGNNMPEVLATAVKHPNRALAGVKGSAGAAFAGSLVGPTGGLAWLNPVTLVGAGPQLVAVTLSNDPDSRQPWHHHTTVVMPFTIISAVETLRRLRRKRASLLKPVSGWMLVSASVSYILMSPTPIGPYAQRWTGATVESVAMHSAADAIPPDASVVATVTPGNLVSNRAVAYTWPNPFKKWKRGYETAPLPSPDTAQYLIVLRRELGKNAALFADLTASTGTYRVISENAGVVVAVRRA